MNRIRNIFRFAAVALAVLEISFPPAAKAGDASETRGAQLFERDWTPATDDPESMGDGLGPLFNARSCDACHPKGDRGTFSVRADGTIEGDGILLKLGIGDQMDPTYGGQVHQRAVRGVKAEGVPAVRFEIVTTPTGRQLRKPVFELRQAAYGPLDSATRIAGRIAQAVFGNGDLERVPESALLRLADPDDRDGDGISGRLNRVELSSGATATGRFGWKAGQWTLLVQSAKAFRMDMGLSSRLMGPAWGDCTAVQRECHEAPNGERSGKGGREIVPDILEVVTAHVAALPPPTRRGSAPDGARVFHETGCAACHVPALPLPDGGTVAAFTDLLLHDTGPGLADGIEEGSASGSEWRTAPLMGLGRLMERGAPLLHDGRARDADEAVRWHGGEAAKAAESYRRLPKADREALMRFLRTL